MKNAITNKNNFLLMLPHHLIPVLPTTLSGQAKALLPPVVTSLHRVDRGLAVAS
ncbi:hypothetical protein GJ688_13560 [Heliobacillus mobilis]|uniref:Uncharacterized protein n=1 Tax=Heliobacterium mobile TaxID=28064 RepID=A0A6I3SN78_HELMO|nr:hypothetical protein [Heliobacterium mobile]